MQFARTKYNKIPKYFYITIYAV